MARYKDGQSVIINNGGKNEVGIIVGRVYNQKQTVYDVLTERMSLLLSIPAGDANASIFLNNALTKTLCTNGEVEANLPPLKQILDSGKMPSYREVANGPRSF